MSNVNQLLREMLSYTVGLSKTGKSEGTNALICYKLGPKLQKHLIFDTILLTFPKNRGRQSPPPTPPNFYGYCDILQLYLLKSFSEIFQISLKFPNFSNSYFGNI